MIFEGGYFSPPELKKLGPLKNQTYVQLWSRSPMNSLVFLHFTISWFSGPFKNDLLEIRKRDHQKVSKTLPETPLAGWLECHRLFWWYSWPARWGLKNQTEIESETKFICGERTRARGNFLEENLMLARGSHPLFEAMTVVERKRVQDSAG